MADTGTRQRLQLALGEALRARDKVATSALRSALAAIDNASAVPAAPAPAAGASGRRRHLGNRAGVVDRGQGRAQRRGRDRVPRLQRLTQGQVQALAGFAVGHIGHPKATLRSACAAVGGKLRG